ncbi:prepilin-type N-terminal cleavage/methylation domain-containing protein [Colwellia demingiae]|uniref:Prepilin-type N-terminal cleavage/methylation domain-containing protein n=1 Tax=Colwellia demingiae TaxID=89401 RepID=A0A5C6QPI5_9GAMM|nr:prepilin-type N-terminal cleavage/methylation domain-containing protein [Colwellia demingiae]TWX70677.1 prepilin-type N-terminal cleavage/methylation domain-containing protein [Colwellia demingiae]
MNICKTKYLSQKGFTLIELIIVVILISIMAITVLPKFLSSNGFEEYTYRDELITKLKAIQLRSMQQTNGTTCRQIQLETNPSSLGLQNTENDPLTSEVCTASYAGDTTTVTVVNKHNVIFTLSGGLSRFSFSSLGRPVASGCGDINTLCELILTVVGETSLEIEINSEGYIHAI